MLSIFIVSRSKTLLDNSSTSMDDMNDFETELQEVFNQVKSMLVLGNKEGAIDLLRANYLLVKEQIDAGTRGMEQAATLDIIALGYMAVGDFKFVESLLEMVKSFFSLPIFHYGKDISFIIFSPIENADCFCYPL